MNDHIAIIGAGNVGGALEQRLAECGFQPHVGRREPGTVEAAVSSSDVVFLAVPAQAAIEALRAAPDLTGKIVIDCTNPLRWETGVEWAPPAEGSVAQAIAAAFPEVRVVKGFNHFGAEIHRNPLLQGGPADAFFAGDHDGAKRKVMDVATRLGFRALDAGPLRNAAVLENLAVLWIHLAMTGQGRRFAFRIDQSEAGSASATS